MIEWYNQPFFLNLSLSNNLRKSKLLLCRLADFFVGLVQKLNYFQNKKIITAASKFRSANTKPDTYPKEGYQNGPKFCDGDKAMVTYMFNVPETIAPS